MDNSQSYFWKIVLLIVLSIVFFCVIKGILPHRLFPEQKAGSNNMLIDSLLLNAIDGTDIKTDSADIKTDSIDVAKSQVDTIKYADDPSIDGEGCVNLSRFYEKLYELESTKSGKVRIGYFGDSMNDGDLIVQDVRLAYQDKYGGQGVGFVPITSLSSASRYSVIHKFSGNWSTQTYITTKSPTKPFGIDGQVSFAKDSTQSYWLRYRAGGMKNAYSLYSPTLFYGQADNNHAYITVKVNKDSTLITKELTPVYNLNTLNVSGYAQSLEINVHNAEGIPFYGFNFDNGQGVHVDNFSMRGNSGLPISVLNTGLMNAIDRKLNYDLIILQYGANVLAVGAKSYDWYGRNMTHVVEHLKHCFPNADILILSTADRAVKKEAEMQTDPGVKLLMKVQKDYARNTGAGYMCLYDLMGGEGSMIEWVDNGLANKDYTHFNPQGSKKLSRLIFQTIEKGYARYKAGHKPVEAEITTNADGTN